jgi:LacI family transcriptional regulator
MGKKAGIEKSPSITDVARKAGVSISTISRAMNDKDRLHPDTYKKVQRAIRDLKYHKARRRPARARQRTVAVVVPTILDPFFSVVLHGIETMAKTYTYNIVLFDSCNSTEIEMKNVTRILDFAPDGVVFVPSGSSPTGYRMLRESGMPVVLLDRLVEKEDSSYVISNDVEGAYLAVKYLIDLGHRSILYIGGEHNTSTEEARLKGYMRALSEHDIPPTKEHIIECSFDSESAYETMTKRLRSGNAEFTAVFAGNDLIAFGIRKALEESGLKVPQDISLVGYGDMPFASLICLTTVSCPALEMAKSALSLLIHIIEEKFISSRKIVMRPTLVLRSSCKRVVSADEAALDNPIVLSHG